jgi:hypothetical protein
MATQSVSVIGDFPVSDWKISILFPEGKYTFSIKRHPLLLSKIRAAHHKRF